MPWNETVTMQRLKFIAAWLEGGLSKSELCRQFGISRKTGDKWINRFEPDNIGDSLSDRSRVRHSQQRTPADMVQLLLEAKAEKPLWGPLKIRQFLLNRGLTGIPAASTIGNIFKAHDLVLPRQPSRKAPVRRQPLYETRQPNDVWCADFKGKFIHASRRWCHPFTLTDNFSRMLFSCEATYKTDGMFVQTCLERAFREYGLPDVLRTDNGTPFAGSGLAGLSAVSVWLIKCGVTPERIRPGKPTENGRHERMHRTLEEVLKHQGPVHSLAQQQAIFDRWRQEFNEERPHQALAGKTPSAIWRPAARRYNGAQKELPVPDGTTLRRVHQHGTITVSGNRVFLSQALRSEWIWMRECEEGLDEVGYGGMILAWYDRKNHRIIPFTET